MSIQSIINNQIHTKVDTPEMIRSEALIPRHYEIDESVDRLIYEEDKLVDKLEDYLIETLIQDIFYSKNYIMRVSALRQLNSWIDQEKIKRIFKIIAKNEKDPDLREFANQLLEIE